MLLPCLVTGCTTYYRYEEYGYRSVGKLTAVSSQFKIGVYKGDPNVPQALHRGAELPIADAKTFIDLVSTLCAVYNAGQAAAQTTQERRNS